MPAVQYICAALMAYLLGSIPTGFLVARARGVDIRTVGSGNIGATNAFRVLGRTAGTFVLVADGLKGYAACEWLVDGLVQWQGVPQHGAEPLRIIAGFAAVLGHSFTCWLHFRGGKGVATSAGVFIALTPIPAIIALSTWIGVFAVSRYVSLASIIGCVALTAATWIGPNSLALRLVATMVSATVIWRHKSNIRRLLQGTEHRFGRKQTAPEAAK